MRNFSVPIIKESSVQTSIIKYLKSEGWFVTKLVSTSTSGIPDLLAIRNGRTIFIEVKRIGGKTSSIQDYRIKELKSYGVEVFIFDNLQDAKRTLNYQDSKMNERKLTMAEAEQLREDYKKPINTYRSLSEKYGISIKAIHLIISYKTYK